MDEALIERAQQGDPNAFGLLVELHSETAGRDAISGYRYGSVLGLASGAKGDDACGYREEFLNLVRFAEILENNT